MTIEIEVVKEQPYPPDPSSCNPLRLYKVKEEGNPNALYFLGRISQTNAPTICYFHGYSSAGGSLHIQDIHPELHEKFNLVMLQDRGGYRRQGSGFIGGKIWEGPYILLFKKLIDELRNSMVASRIITGGASMGGYSALLYSIFLEADECYASCPQTSLNPNAWYYSIDEDFNRISETSQIKPWSEGYLKSLGINDTRSFEKIRSKYPFVDLPHFIRRLSSELSLKFSFINDDLNFEELVTKFPSTYYHITSCRYDHPKDYNSSYQSEFIQPLMSAMVDSGIHYSQLTLPFPGHDHFHGPSVIAIYSSKYQEFVNLRVSADQSLGHELDRYSASYLRKEKQFINAIHLLL